MRVLVWAIVGVVVVWFGTAHRVAAVTPAPALPAPAEGVAAYIEQELAAVGVPGAAYALVHGDAVVLSRGYGRADATGRAVTPQTSFIIGSLSKSFTALALMQLAEAGRVDLDAPVQRYLPWFTLADAEAARAITIRHALTHTTGIAWIDGLAALDSRDMQPDALQRRLELLRTVQPVDPPGVQFRYSNVNYVIVGAVIEAVTGAPYEQAIAEGIFAPLALEASFTSRTAAEPDLAVGHRYWFGAPIAGPELPYGRSDLPSYLLIAGADDLARYLIALLNPADPTLNPLLTPEGIAAVQRGSAPTPWGDAYALGWFDEDWAGVRVINHYGSYAGYHADMLFAPEERLGLVLLTNAESYVAYERRWDIASNAFRLVLGQPLETPPLVSLSGMAFGVVLLLLLLLAVDIALTLRGVLRAPQAGLRRTPRWRRQMTLTTLAPLGLAGIFLLGVPRAFDATLTAIVLTTPDVGWTLLIGGSMALGWSCIRAIGLFRHMIYERSSTADAARTESRSATR